MTELTPKQCLAMVKKNILYIKAITGLEEQYNAAIVKDEALKQKLLERVNKRMIRVPPVIPLLWEDLHDIDEVITMGWDELVKLGISSPLLHYSIICICMLQRIEDWFTIGKRNHPTVSKPAALPKEILDAERRIFTHYTKGGMVNSRQAVIRAKKLIKEDSPAHIAILMMICHEADAILENVKNPDFIRALIGLHALPYMDEAAIRKMSNGMNKKLNGNSRDGKKTPLSPKHSEWKGSDKIMGDKLYSFFI